MCGAALHFGVIDNDGGWLDVTRLGRKQHFTKSYKNGIQSIGYESISVFSFDEKVLSVIQFEYIFISFIDDVQLMMHDFTAQTITSCYF